MSPAADDLEPMGDSAEDLAAGWFARRRSGEMTEQDGRALEAWLDADPAHRAAFDTLERAWSDIEVARRDPAVLALRARARRRDGRRRIAPGRALAASLALAVAGGAGAWWAIGPDGFGLHRFATESFHTGVGERASVTLADGSVVTLNTNTVLRTRASRDQRLVYLDRGQAFFRVAKDRAHPFIVTAGGRTVTAVGTAFDVRVDAHRFAVTLVEGKVRVETPAPPAPGPRRSGAVQTTEMLAGNQFTAPDNRRWSVSQTDTARETSWLIGRLKFDNEPLGAVAQEFERYSNRRIVMDDPRLAVTTISGTFQAVDMEAFVRALQTYKVARVESETATTIRLAAPAGG